MVTEERRRGAGGTATPASACSALLANHLVGAGPAAAFMFVCFVQDSESEVASNATSARLKSTHHGPTPGRPRRSTPRAATTTPRRGSVQRRTRARHRRSAKGASARQARP